MKAFISSILLFFVAFPVFSQPEWGSQYVGWNQTISDVQIVDANTVYIALARSGDWPRVLKTTNRGANWIQLWCEDRSGYPAIYFLNSNTGFVFVDNVIEKTVNGGASWPSKITFPQNSDDRRIKFVNAQTGYALFNKGYNPPGVTLYKTINGGENWFIPHPSYENFNSNNIYYSVLKDIDFSTLSANNVCIVEYSQFPSGWASGGMISSDGFSTPQASQPWFSTNPNSINLKHVRFVYDPNNPNDKWRFAGYAGIYKYDNSYSAPRISGYLNAEYGLTYSNYNLGFCAGAGGIWSTTNSGYNWTNEFNNAGDVLTDSRMQSVGDVCYIGSKNGNLRFRKFPMDLNTNFDWQNNLYNGSFKIDGTVYSTPQTNVRLRGGTSILGTNNNRFLKSGSDTTAQFYYWGGTGGNASTDYYDNPNYFVNIGDLNADYKMHLKSHDAGAINTASQTKSVIDENGVVNTVYSSMQGIFYTRSYNSGSKLKSEEYLSITQTNLAIAYATFSNSNPYITIIKPLGEGISINPEKNVAVTWERRVGNNIDIKYSERSIVDNFFTWDTDQQAVTISSAPSGFNAFPKLFVAKNPGSGLYFRLITYLRPSTNGSAEIVVNAKKKLNGEQTREFVIDAGIIPSYSVAATYISYGETSYDLHFAYMKNGRLWYKHTKINADPQLGLHEVPYYGQDEYKDLSTLDFLQNRGEPDITLRNANNDPNNINMQPVVTFKGQYTVIIIDPSGGDGSSQPISQTYYPIVYRERLSSNNWANANFQFLSSAPQQNPNIEGSKKRNSYLINFSQNNTTFFQKVGRWNNLLNTYYCVPGSFTGKDAKLTRGALVDNSSTSQKIITLSNSVAPYQIGNQSFNISQIYDPDSPDAVCGVVTSNNMTYSFNLGSIIVNGQLINFYPDMDSLIDTPTELNDNLKSQPFFLNDDDTLIIGRNAFYLDEGGGEFTEVQYAVYLTNNGSGEKFLELARDTVHAGDSINVEYLEGFIIQNIPGGSDSFYVQMEIDTVWAGGGDLGLSSISTDLGGGDSPALMKRVFWKTAKVVSNNIPTVFNLYQNFPNPFNPVTKIKYDLPKNVNVTIKVYDIIGREVVTLVNNEFKNAGRYVVNWNANNYASGVYIYRLQAGDYVSTKKMVLIK